VRPHIGVSPSVTANAEQIALRQFTSKAGAGSPDAVAAGYVEVLGEGIAVMPVETNLPAPAVRFPTILAPRSPRFSFKIKDLAHLGSSTGALGRRFLEVVAGLHPVATRDVHLVRCPEHRAATTAGA